MFPHSFLARLSLPGLPVWLTLLGVEIVILATPASGAEASNAEQSQPAAKEDRQGIEFFENKIRPLLAERCLECHGPDKQKGGLRLDSRAMLLEGGDSGPAVTPGKPEESLLINVVGYMGDVKMPPKSKLPDHEIAQLLEWVKRGAPWTSGEAVAAAKRPVEGPLFTSEQKTFWAFQPIADPAPPEVKDVAWPKSPLDRFILVELEGKNIRPAPPADKRTLIRRATFALIGLPPSPAETRAFVEDESADPFAKVIDRLLASERYGERWGRHWLDVARYAESNGLDENLAYAHAYRYRDYVVNAFNHDKPYDQFVQEQIAGDLLPATSNPQVQFERLTATGFLGLGAKMLAEDDPVKMQMDIIDEQVDTIGRAFLGLTLGCARCHDHKFDPIPAEDYYSLAGIFKSTKTMENFSVVARWQERPLATPEDLQKQQAQVAQINDKKKSIADVSGAADGELLRDVEAHTAEYLLAATELRNLEARLQSLKSGPAGVKSPDIAGVQLIEAEDYPRGNAFKDLTNYGKDIGIIASAGNQLSFVEYDITAPEAELYQLQFRYAAAGARPVKILVNGELVLSDAAGKATGTWFPDTQAWFVEGLFKLRAGNNVLRIERPEPFPHFDKLLLVPVRFVETTAAPAAYQPLPVFVQQWAAYLESTKSDPKSPLAAWHAYLADPQVRLDEQGPAGVLGPKLGDFKPASREVLARRYQELLDEAGLAWKTLKASDQEKNALALPDPALEALRQLRADPKGPYAIPKDIASYYRPETVADLARQRGELAALEQALPKFDEVMAVSENKPENLKVHLRGSHLTLGKETPRQFLRIITGESQSPIDNERSGRLELAAWLTSPTHPLTSRVMVNRLWQGHFGEGLVRSPDNFGRLGERPSHPQLLDWLAQRFMESGWSLKAMHRLIMLSATYQMSTAYNAEAALADPENRLCWRMNRRRLEVEAMRDAILAVSGSLDVTMGGTLLPTPNRNYVTSTANVNPVVYEAPRRSIYLPVIRSALYELFQAFDFADPSTLNGKRDNTTVAPQALFMMNSKFVLQETRKIATELLADQSLDDTGRVRSIYERAYGRPPTLLELSRGLDYVRRYAEATAAKQTEPTESRLRAWQSLCRGVIAANEFIYVE